MSKNFKFTEVHNWTVLMQLKNYYNINILRHKNFFFITQGNYVGYMFRLLNSHLQAYSLQVRSV